MKHFLLALVCVASPTLVNAGTASDWFNSTIRQMDSPLLDTLSLYRSQGLVLVDVNNDYAAYSTAAKRLTDSEKDKIGSAESDKTIVISFNSCPGTRGYLTGSVSTISVKYKMDNLERFTSEFRDLIATIDSNNSFSKLTFGVSKNNKNQTYFSWKRSDGTTVELQINGERDAHTLVVIANKACR